MHLCSLILHRHLCLILVDHLHLIHRYSRYRGTCLNGRGLSWVVDYRLRHLTFEFIRFGKFRRGSVSSLWLIAIAQRNIIKLLKLLILIITIMLPIVYQKTMLALFSRISPLLYDVSIFSSGFAPCLFIHTGKIRLLCLRYLGPGIRIWNIR